MAECVNVPKAIATVISSGLATLHELSTVYGTTDLWWLLEVNTVDLHNKRIANEVEGE